MKNEQMVDRFIDYVNNRIEDLDMSKSSLARSIGQDKNSMSKYLKKDRTMPLHVALKIANYLNMDISKVCGIKTEQVLSADELNLVKELRNIRNDSTQAKVETDLASIIKAFNSNR